MGNQRRHRLQRLHRSCGASWQIKDQGAAAHCAHSAAQRRVWSLLRTLTSHALGHALEQAVANCYCRFRRYIAQGDPCSAGSHDESRFAREANEQVLNLNCVVRNHFPRDHFEVKFLQKLSDRRPRQVCTFAACAGIADRDYGCRESPRLSCRGGHLPLLLFRLGRRRWGRQAVRLGRRVWLGPPQPVRPRHRHAAIHRANAGLPSIVPAC